MRSRDLVAGLRELEAFEREGQYQDALSLVHKLDSEYPGMREWTFDLARLERKIHLADLYQRALGALQSGNPRTARIHLIEIIVLDPQYEEATRYLHLAVTGVDVAELQTEFELRQQKLAELEREMQERTQAWREAQERALAAERLSFDERGGCKTSRIVSII